MLTLDSWIEAGKLGVNGSSGAVGEDEIIGKGFHFVSATNGMNFSVGQIKLTQEELAQGGVIRKRLLLCKIAVGRSYNASEEVAKVAAIPDGYDSFVIDSEEKIRLHPNSPDHSSHTASRETLKTSEESPRDIHSLNKLEYVIKDTSQILPTFVVVFEFDLEAEKRSRQKSICDNCESVPAAVFCQADSANLCEACDSQLHSSKLTCRHVRTPLEAGPQTFSACRHHSDKLVEFFCPTCSRPVCVHCKMVGHHSTGDAARHKLITVAEAFRGVSESAKAIDPLLESRKQRITNQIASVVERAKSIEANAAEIQQQLEEIYKRALSDLKNITKKKLNVLKGDMIELYREASEISQLISFLEYQQSGGNATQFILDWAYHQKLRTELHSFPHFRETIDVHPDIKINGAIQVHVDGAGIHQVADGASFGDYVRGGSPSIDGGRPRYLQNSPTRSRMAPSIDFSNLTKSRKPTDPLDSVPLSASIANNILGSPAKDSTSPLTKS